MCLVIAQESARAWDYEMQGNTPSNCLPQPPRAVEMLKSITLIPAAEPWWGAAWVQTAQCHPPPRLALLPEKALGDHRASLVGPASPGPHGSCNFHSILSGNWGMYCLQGGKGTYCMVGQSDHLNEIQSYLLAQRQQVQVSREKCSGAWSPWRAEDSAGVHPVGRSMRLAGVLLRCTCMNPGGWCMRFGFFHPHGTVSETKPCSLPVCGSGDTGGQWIHSVALLWGKEQYLLQATSWRTLFPFPMRANPVSRKCHGAPWDCHNKMSHAGGEHEGDSTGSNTAGWDEAALPVAEPPPVGTGQARPVPAVAQWLGSSLEAPK